MHLSQQTVFSFPLCYSQPTPGEHLNTRTAAVMVRDTAAIRPFLSVAASL